MEDLIEVESKYGKLYYEKYRLKGIQWWDTVKLYNSQKKIICYIGFCNIKYEYLTCDKLKHWLVEEAEKSTNMESFIKKISSNIITEEVRIDEREKEWHTPNEGSASERLQDVYFFTLEKASGGYIRVQVSRDIYNAYYTDSYVKNLEIKDVCIRPDLVKED